jgi:hypothetical protein
MNIWENFERIGLFITLVGFVILGYLSYQNINNNRQIIDRINSFETSLNSFRQSVSNSTIQQFSNSCDAVCIRKLVNEAIASMSGITKPQKEQVVERVVEKVQTVSGNSPKTQYVSLGAGETISTEWVTIPGAEVTFNINDFGKVAAVYFEAQLQSASGKVYARLYDKNTGPFLDSEVSHSAGDAKLISAGVNISGGGRTIGVQLKSEIQQPVKILSSRLRIDTK